MEIGTLTKCRKCGVSKLYTPEFFTIGKNKRRQCHECMNAYYAEYRAKNLTSVRSNANNWAKRNYLLRSYGITEEDYIQMLADQSGTCKICHEPPGKRRLHVDHDHQTGKVRGLLCSNCNAALGMVDDNIQILADMISYLTKE